MFADGHIEGDADAVTRWQSDGSDRTRPDGRGWIAPGESREFQLDLRLLGKVQLPVLRINFVMFDDLVFEGDQANREMLARHRQEQADDIEFLIAVRNEATTKPPAEVLDFLAAKRAECVTTLQTRGRIPSVSLLDLLIENVKRWPEHLRDPAFVQDLERRREELGRHLRQ